MKKEYKKKNLRKAFPVLTLTEKPTNIINDRGTLEFIKNAQVASTINSIVTGFHLHILSNDEIKVGDWVKLSDYNGQPVKVTNIDENYLEALDWKKIIASTDKDLGLLSPSNNFIHRYISLGKIEEVLVEYIWEGTSTAFGFSMGDASTDGEWVLKEIDGRISIKAVQQYYHREEVKQHLMYCVSELAAQFGHTPTSIEMKKWNEATREWIYQNIN